MPTQNRNFVCDLCGRKKRMLAFCRNPVQRCRQEVRGLDEGDPPACQEEETPIMDNIQNNQRKRPVSTGEYRIGRPPFTFTKSRWNYVWVADCAGPDAGPE